MTVRRARVVLLAIGAAAALLPGCRPPPDRLEVLERIPLPGDAAESLHVDSAERLWIGRPGELVVVGSGGAVEGRIGSAGPGVPRVVATLGGRVYVQAGDSLLSIDRSTLRRTAIGSAPDGGRIVEDVRGRILFRGVSSGAVFAHDPRTLVVAWAWASRGAPTTALAPAPEGDVLWQALAIGESGGEILGRDIQTGRILSREALPGRISALFTTATGDLLVLLGEGPRATVLRLRPRGGALDPVWRHPVDLSGERFRALQQGDGEALAILGGGDEAGLRVLDAEAGSPKGSVESAPRDAAFAPDGSLYLLYAREIRVVGAR